MGVRVKNFFHDAVYFVTITACEWQKVFEYPECRELVYKWFDYQKTHYQNKIHGYVIMPNHIHFILYISKESPPLSKIIQNGKRFMAYDIVKYLKSHEAESSTRDSTKGLEKKKHILDVFESQARKEKGSFHKVFEERYDAKLLDNDAIYREKLKYIHNNPIKDPWVLCKLPEDYQYSSASNYILGKGVYLVDILI